MREESIDHRQIVFFVPSTLCEGSSSATDREKGATVGRCLRYFRDH